MQWDSSANAGFTQADIKAWLPIHPTYATVNVQVQIFLKEILHILSIFFYFLSNNCKIQNQHYEFSVIWLE
jgi:hypothetical protein